MPVHHGGAKVTLQHATHVLEILEIQGLVETELLLQFVDLLSGGLRASGQPHRIPRHYVGDGESDDRQPDEDRDD
jgi:hypothetical protein